MSRHGRQPALKSYRKTSTTIQKCHAFLFVWIYLRSFINTRNPVKASGTHPTERAADRIPLGAVETGSSSFDMAADRNATSSGTVGPPGIDLRLF